MGNLSPVQYQVTKPLSHTWQEVTSNRPPINNHKSTLLRNSVTGEEALEYQIHLPTDTLEDEFRKYDLRARQNLHLVTVKSVEVREEGGTCSRVKNRLRVVTEKIDHNLASHPKLSYHEGARVLLKALIGFKAIYQFQGYIKVHSNLIFFNQYGEVKVWMNQNLPLNQPQKRFLSGNKFGSQPDMINDIVLTIEYHLSNPKEFAEIKRSLMPLGTITFQKAIATLTQDLEGRNKRYSTYYHNQQPTDNSSIIKELESKGLKVVNTRETKRYVEEPGQTIIREVEGANRATYLNQNLNYQGNARQHLSPQPVRTTSPIRETQRPSYYHQEYQIRNSSRERVSSIQKEVHIPQAPYLVEKPRKSIISPPVKNRSIRVNSRESERHRNIPSTPSQQMIYYSRNVNSSPPQRNPVRQQSRERLVSASPYFHYHGPAQQQPQIHPPSRSPSKLQQPIRRQSPHIAHQPIIRKEKIKDLQISNVSRVSLNSHQSADQSYRKLFSPKALPRQIEGGKKLQIRQVQTNHLLDSSGYIKASVKQSFPSNQPNEPSIKLFVYPPQDTVIAQNLTIQNNIVLIEPVSVQTFAPKSSQGKQGGWVKIYKGEGKNYNTNRIESNNRQVNVGRGKQRVFEQAGGTFTNKNFSETDFHDPYERENSQRYGMTQMPRQVSEKGSQVDTSKQSHKMKMDSKLSNSATVHYDSSSQKPQTAYYMDEIRENWGYDRERRD